MKQEKLIKQALRYAMVPIILSFIVTPLRFSLELAGLPEVSIFLIGLLWLTLAFAIYWGVKFFNEERPYRLLLLSLVLFAPISRLTVFVAWWVDKKWQLGTHYGLYFETWQQALLNQVVYGALVQIIPGFIVGASTIALMRLKRRIKSADRESK